MRHYRAPGLTLIELVAAIAVLSILAGMGMPPLLSLIERIRLKGAAEKIYADLGLARSEAIRRDVPVTVSFRSDAAHDRWCYALTTAAECDCLAADDCGLKLAPGRGGASTDFRGLRLGSNFRRGNLRFFPARGTATPGTVSLSGGERRVEIKISALGRIRTCAHHLRGYPPC